MVYCAGFARKSRTPTADDQQWWSSQMSHVQRHIPCYLAAVVFNLRHANVLLFPT